LCLDEGVGVIPWSPLARGFLAGNRRPEGTEATPRAQTDDFARKLYYAESDFRTVDRVVAVADQRGVKPAQIALAWLLHKPGVTAPIVGASKMYQLDDAVAAVDMTLSEDEVRQLEEVYEPHAVKM
jgi:1-deoxyxylulose-5-phosphate synthase